MSYVADTHAFVWYITGKLPERVDSIFRSAEEGSPPIYSDNRAGGVPVPSGEQEK